VWRRVEPCRGSQTDIGSLLPSCSYKTRQHTLENLDTVPPQAVVNYSVWSAALDKTQINRLHYCSHIFSVYCKHFYSQAHQFSCSFLQNTYLWFLYLLLLYVFYIKMYNKVVPLDAQYKPVTENILSYFYFKQSGVEKDHCPLPHFMCGHVRNCVVHVTN
jgi:hypothetical protein